MESALFYLDTLIDMDSLKNQGINTDQIDPSKLLKLDIHLNIKVLTPATALDLPLDPLDIHLNIKVLTP